MPDFPGIESPSNRERARRFLALRAKREPMPKTASLADRMRRAAYSTPGAILILAACAAFLMLTLWHSYR